MTSATQPQQPDNQSSRPDEESKPSPEHISELLRRRAAAGHDEADAITAQVVREHLPLVLALASRYRGRGESWDDLVQVAGLGLFLAVQRYRVDAEVPFLGYAVPTILGELRRHLRDHAWAVKPPRRLQELRPVVLRAQEELTQRLGRSPTINEVAAEAGAEIADTVEALTLATAYRPDSLDALILEPGDRAETLAAPTTPLSDVDTRMAVGPALASLSSPARRVLHLYYVEAHSQREIAERIGVSQMQVSRLLKSARASLAKAVDTSDSD